MSTLFRSEKSSLLRKATATILAAVGMSMAITLAADPIAYSGKGVMCFADPTNMQEVPTEKGKGKTITTGGVFVWRIVSDNPLMNGWEYTYDNWILNKQGKGTIWGHLTFFPDVAHDGVDYTGRFVEDEYSFKTNKLVSGIYTGEGSLNGVTATYEGTASGFEPCPVSDLPPAMCVDGTLTCIPVGELGSTTYIEGVIEGYEP